MHSVVIELGTWRCARWTAAGDVIRGKDSQRAFNAVFFAVAGRLTTQARCHLKSVGRDAQRSMVMKASPATSFTVAQAKLLFEILVVTLDSPARLRDERELLERGVFRYCAHEVLERFDVALGPFD